MGVEVVCVWHYLVSVGSLGIVDCLVHVQWERSGDSNDTGQVENTKGNK